MDSTQGLRLIAIAAMGENRVIGVNNTLPWDIPEDLQFFRQTTKGHSCIFGRKTLDSMGRLLPGRFNIIVSRDSHYQPPGSTKTEFVVVPNLEQAFGQARARSAVYGNDVYICGGGEIYRQALPFIERVYLTVIHRAVEGDTLFPMLDEKEFRLTERKDRSEPEPFSFCTYDRIYVQKIAE